MGQLLLRPGQTISSAPGVDAVNCSLLVALSRLLKCDHCACAFDNTIVETLKQIVALPEALGKHSCECGHPEMRRLPDGVFHCPVCRAEVLPVSIPEPRPVAARKSLAALEQIPLNLGAPDEEGDRLIASGGGGNGG